MAYSKDFRECVMKNYDSGMSKGEILRIFGIGEPTLKEWKKLRKETGSLERRPLERAASKFKGAELIAYVEENPTATLEEIARHFGGSTSGAFYALEREGITLKKRALLRGTE